MIGLSNPLPTLVQKSALIRLGHIQLFMNPQTLTSLLDTLEQDGRLRVAANLALRHNALGFIEAAMESAPGMELERLARLRERLQAIDSALFDEVRGKIQGGHYTSISLRTEFEQLSGYVRWNKADTRHTYDALDALLNGLMVLNDRAMFHQPTADPEMVFYDPTPARIVLALADQVTFKPEDVFYDLGSGTGRVPILLTLITGIRTKGVEYDPSLHILAHGAAALLNLSNVTFIQGDARTVDYSEANVFYMFTPFQGAMFQVVLDRLQAEAAQRPIRIIAYGGCVAIMREQRWLIDCTSSELSDYRLGVFESQ